MTSHITPLPRQPQVARLDVRSYPSARGALRAVLESLADERPFRVLLPSYIGWSSREGSGVFDPVRELGLDYAFYRISRGLRIDGDDLIRMARQPGVRAILLIHWFGVVDPLAARLVRRLRAMGKWVIEDCAHALLSDRVDGSCGHLGHAAVYSLHKLLPLNRGGLLRINDPDLSQLLRDRHRGQDWLRTLAEYDLGAIARCRRNNARLLDAMIRRCRPAVTPMLGRLPERATLQSFPVVVKSGLRDRLYFGLNERGYGVVSLYHALIPEIVRRRYGDAYWLSDRILNLPLHQELNATSIRGLVGAVKALVGAP